MNHLKRLFLTLFLTTCCILTTAIEANADTYRAGRFLITINDNQNGRTYVGCNNKGQCIRLENGTKWIDKGYRGITWENGDYTYSVSWREGSTNQMYLNVYNKNKRILRERMIPSK
jgi:hypothetical protein